MQVGLKAILKKYGLTQRWLAREMNKPEDQVSKLCNDRSLISPPLAIQVLNILKNNGYPCTLDEIYGVEPVQIKVT